MEIFNALNLSQITGGTKLKQGDFGSVLSYSLADENGQEITSFDTKTAYINLVLDDKILFTTTTQVDISRVTFHIDKAIPTGLYYLEIKIDDYIFPSDKDSVILIEEGATAYDLKDLIPNYDTSMTITGILSDLSQKGIDISSLKTKMNAIYNSALADHADLIATDLTVKNLSDRKADKSEIDARLSQKADKSEIDAKLSQISSVPETFANLAALQSKYPTGKTGIFVTADTGHKFIWANGSWTDAGAYQAVGIADGSVVPTGLSTTLVPNNKKNKNYIAVSKSTDLYILNEPILQNGIANITGKFAAGTIDLYLLVKSGNSYAVSDRKTKSVTDGWNDISTDFYLTGDGSEFIGVIGATYFNSTGGVGFVTVANANRNATTFSSTSINNNYEFSVFLTFENITLSKKVNELENKIGNLSTDTNFIGFGNGIKDFSQYNIIGRNDSIYIPNEVLSKGNVFVHIGSVMEQNGTIYILERSGNSFTVKKSKLVPLSEGENIVNMEYFASGDGSEYIGYLATVHYEESGGTGFWSTPGSTEKSYLEGDTFSATDFRVGVGQNYSFACYPECRESLKEEVVETANKLEELSNNMADITLTDFKTPKYTEIQDKTGFVGRWFDTTIGGIPVKATINEGSELYFKVKNTTTIKVNFVLNSVSATPFFAYSIDGSPMTRQLITNPLLPTVNTGEHIVRVIIDGLTETEDKWIGEKGVAFKDVTVDTGGIVTGIVPKNRQIIFHGDSITAGVRVLNMNADSTGNSATGSFPYVASTNLNAISYRVGFGASGITKGGDGGVPELIQIIDKMTNAREAHYIEPDIVVMNMGTNDWASTTEVFTTKLNEVLDRFSIRYSGTPIFVMVPFNQARKTELTSAVSARSNMYLVDTEGWNITTTDGTHPDVAGGLVAGQKLANAIISVLGKDYFI